MTLLFMRFHLFWGLRYVFVIHGYCIGKFTALNICSGWVPHDTFLCLGHYPCSGIQVGRGCPIRLQGNLAFFLRMGGWDSCTQREAEPLCGILTGWGQRAGCEGFCHSICLKWSKRGDLKIPRKRQKQGSILRQR